MISFKLQRLRASTGLTTWKSAGSGRVALPFTLYYRSPFPQLSVRVNLLDLEGTLKVTPARDAGVSGWGMTADYSEHVVAQVY